MEIPDFLSITQQVGSTGFLIFIVWKLLEKYIFKNSVEDKIYTLKNNHMAHFSEDLKTMQTNISEISREVNAQGNRLTKLETKLEK